MPITKTEVSKTITPKIPDWVDSETREAILEEVGRYVVTEIALHVGDGKSPVDGYGEFKRLTEEYADEEKGGDRTPNLELEGDMLAALQWRVEMGSVNIGYFNKDQAIKAYGHNTGMEGHPWLYGKTPVRKSIPGEGEKFNKSIEDGIASIVEDMVSQIVNEEDEDEAVGGSPSGSSVGATPSNSTIPDWLSDEDDDDGWGF